LQALQQAHQSIFADGALVITPTARVTPPRLAETRDPVAYRALNLAALGNTAIANYLGLCAMSLPAGTDRAGMPVGLQLLGPGGSEIRLLAAGIAIERQLDCRLIPGNLLSLDSS
jgi:aspartyl-tRNA(Asn)/glutamyl-tRNA(Gln) amidotransferase subunit A